MYGISSIKHKRDRSISLGTDPPLANHNPATSVPPGTGNRNKSPQADKNL